ncbi:hypothetical protein GQ600_17247 [Phytophthora cactorum]|nr:hypothetical protein GQ600_17247 [Phytophthora cactorum]
MEKVPSPHESEPLDTSPSPDQAKPSKIYGEVVSELANSLRCRECCPDYFVWHSGGLRGADSSNIQGGHNCMGLEVDLLYQLLHEVSLIISYIISLARSQTNILLQLFSMHQKEIRASITSLPPLQQQETDKNPAELKEILGSEEEETKEDNAVPVVADSVPANADAGSAIASE